MYIRLLCCSHWIMTKVPKRGQLCKKKDRILDCRLLNVSGLSINNMQIRDDEQPSARSVIIPRLTALSLVFALILCNAGTVRSASAPVVPRDLMQKAQSDGRVRVIVELAISAAARAAVDSDIVGALRRQEVAGARD